MKKGGAVSMPQKRYELLQTLLWHTFSSMRGEVVVVTCVNGEQFVGILLRLEESRSCISAIILKHAQKHGESESSTMTDSTGAVLLKTGFSSLLPRERNPLTTSDLSKLCSGREYSDEKRIPMAEFAHLYAPRIGFESEMPSDELGKARDLEEFQFDATEAGIRKEDLEWDTGGSSSLLSVSGEELASSMTAAGEGSFDQFADKPTTYDENLYTVEFDSSKVSERELNDAKLIAEEIEATETDNIHVLEDRNQVTHRVSDLDEEDAFSAVLTSDTKPFIPSKSTPVFTPSSMADHSRSSSYPSESHTSGGYSRRSLDETFVDSEITAKLSKEGHRGSLKTLRKSELTPAQSLPSIDEEKTSVPSSMPDLQRRTVAQPKLRAAAEAFVPSEQPTMMMGTPQTGAMTSHVSAMGMHDTGDGGGLSAMQYDPYGHTAAAAAAAAASGGHHTPMHPGMAPSATAVPQYHPGHLHPPRVAASAAAMQTPVYLPSGGMSHLMGGAHAAPAAAVGQAVMPGTMDPAHHAYYMQQQSRPMAFHPAAHSMHAQPAGAHTMSHLIHHMPRHM